jgi:hypothetical protein
MNVRNMVDELYQSWKEIIQKQWDWSHCFFVLFTNC